MKQLVIASNNAHKAQEISDILSFPGWEFVTLRDLGIVSNPPEDADSFLGNARIKAHAAHKASGGLAALADDSGLEVDALQGAPGVFSSRYAGEGASDTENNEKLLAALADVPDEERRARFVCTLVLVDENGAETVARGVLEGRIGHAPAGEGGFGYDPLFYPDAFGGSLSLAQVNPEEKNAISHRGSALRTLRDILEQNFESEGAEKSAEKPARRQRVK